ncbi:type I DNA topoisomerase [Leptolyngbya sp. FACHB-261]|uniref:type I DNA topoisomerase n=1 Tax=Leptolyngbya sp. FACHB-261 TaxID=2692806 RepID=UPI0016839C71|nr:type I DNA topoisomerase [Leptolyngbya sp. FACHB-261]MBD2100439.1 type I DNA topoisomerase [Leptolyngbya sp. FACHB-261]
MPKLLICESPGKLSTLRKLLGAGWDVQASVGHIMALANDGVDSLGFDLHFDRVECRYVPRGDRGKEVISKLRAAAKQASEVYLATDSDREGEAIAWHLARELKLRNPRRITYTQITEQAVRAALRSPRPIDEHLVSAQRCRQCLDKLVGYRVSPLLWQSTGGKSAGRVQSAALHLVCLREREIQAFVPQTYWSVWCEYQQGFRAYYHGSVQGTVHAPETHAPETAVDPEANPEANLDDATDAQERVKAPESRRVTSLEEAERLVKLARQHVHQVVSVEGQETHKPPPPPFITSSLQQSAGALLSFSPEKTMQVAQKLYEGVDLPGGKRQGVITYMRTDSVALAPEFVEAVRAYLQQHDPQNLPAKQTRHRNRAESQAAHEAIRPTEISLTPEALAGCLSQDEHRLYDLIWRRALASQCAAARLLKTRALIQSGPLLWQAKGMVVEFAGYSRYWDNLDTAVALPELTQNQQLQLKKAAHEEKQTQPPPRYSEPKLVQLMERKGIGRPSTFAAIVGILKQREYVETRGKVLHPTALGLETDQVLTTGLPDLVESEFTAQMEVSLDQIAEGKQLWEAYLVSWNQAYLIPALEKAKKVILAQFPTAPPRTGSRERERSRTKCPQCKQSMSKLPSKKVAKKYFLKCENGCADVVMFWSDLRKTWETPHTKTNSAAEPKFQPGQSQPAKRPVTKRPAVKENQPAKARTTTKRSRKKPLEALESPKERLSLNQNSPKTAQAPATSVESLRAWYQAARSLGKSEQYLKRIAEVAHEFKAGQPLSDKVMLAMQQDLSLLAAQKPS